MHAELNWCLYKVGHAKPYYSVRAYNIGGNGFETAQQQVMVNQ